MEKHVELSNLCHDVWYREEDGAAIGFNEDGVFRFDNPFCLDNEDLKQVTGHYSLINDSINISYKLHDDEINEVIKFEDNEVLNSAFLNGHWVQLLDNMVMNMYTGTDNNYLKSWMKNIPDSWRLSDMSIPGTHDSATSKMHWSYVTRDYAITQGETIAQQLKDGIRFLDLRVGACGKDDKNQGSDNRLDLWHGDLPWEYHCGVSYESTLNDIMSFLKDNPSETVIVSIKEENHTSPKDFLGMLQPYFDSTSYKWFLENRVPTLGEARGKIVLFRRFNYTGTLGLNMRDNWANDACSEFTNGHMTTYVEDVYCTLSNWSTVSQRAARKVEYITNAQNKVNDSRGNVLGIIFWSHSFSPLAGPETYARAVNSKMFGHVFNYFRRKRSYGIFPMDYYDKEYVRWMIQSNFMPYVTEIQNGNVYQIVNKTTWKALDIRGGNKSANAQMILYEQYWANDAQTFRFEKVNNKYWKIINTGSNLPIAPDGNIEKNWIRQGIRMDTNAILWEAIYKGDAIFSFKNVETGYYLDNLGAENKNENIICQYRDNDTDAQKFLLIPLTRK